MSEDYESLYHPRRQALYAALVFSVLGLALNTETFVSWAREAPFPPATTEWLMEQADRIDMAGDEAGLDALTRRVRDWVEGLREP